MESWKMDQLLSPVVSDNTRSAYAVYFDYQGMKIAHEGELVFIEKIPAESRADLLARSEEKTWKDSSVHILLNGLLQKEAIREAGLVKRSKTYGRVFVPTLTREEYFAATIFCHRHKPEIRGLFRALLERPEITGEDLKAIGDMIAEKQK